MVMLIVGLGNPGDQYIKTRHNAGFLFIDELVSGSNITMSYASKFKADVARFKLNGVDVHVLKPQTFMNKSGSSVGAYAKYYDIPVEQILIAHDELDLPSGDVKLKRAGGHGGHNGLRDIINHLASKDFYRVRLGIGHPGDKSQVSDYVLSRASRHEEKNLLEAVSKSLGVMSDVVQGEYQRAMQTLHAS